MLDSRSVVCTGDGESEEDKGDNNKEESSFSFLHAHQGDEGQDSDSGKSSSDEATSSGFAFLNTTTKETEERQGDQRKETVDDQQSPPGLGERMEQKDVSTDSKHDTEASTPSSDKSSELPSLPRPTIVTEEEPSIAVRSPLKVGGGRTAGRQLPPASGAVKKKKKKRKAVVPGKERMASGTSSQAEPESTSSSKSDLSSRIDDETVAPHDEVSKHSEQLIDLAAASSEHDGEDCLAAEITVKLAQDETTTPQENEHSVASREDHVHSTATEENEHSTATEDVDAADTSIQKEPTIPEPVAMETADEADESRALEEVFGNYRVELSGEESYAALIEGYQSSIKKIR